MYFHLLPFCSNHFPPRSRAGRLLTRRQVTRIDTAGCGEAVEGPGWRCSTVIPSDLDGKCRHVGFPLVGKSVKFGEMVIYTSCEMLLMIWERFWNSGLWPQSGSSYTWGILCLELPTRFNRKERCSYVFHNHLNDHRTNFHKSYSYSTAYDRRDPQFLAVGPAPSGVKWGSANLWSWAIVENSVPWIPTIRTSLTTSTTPEREWIQSSFLTIFNTMYYCFPFLVYFAV